MFRSEEVDDALDCFPEHRPLILFTFYNPPRSWSIHPQGNIVSSFETSFAFEARGLNEWDLPRSLPSSLQVIRCVTGIHCVELASSPFRGFDLTNSLAALARYGLMALLLFLHLQMWG